MNRNIAIVSRITLIIVLLLICFFLFPLSGSGKENEKIKSIKWQKGPCIGYLGSIAEIHVPAGYVFADANDTRILMEELHNPVSGKELGFIASSEGWFLIFDFYNIGYIKDDEKDLLNADELLKSLKANNEAANKERMKRGWHIMTITGWEILPHYNQQTHNLEWAIKCESEGKPVINFNTRLLGREGVMNVTLVADPSLLKGVLPNYRQVLSNYSFKPGRKYAEFRQGDKIAKYGLSALIAGGATAVAVKSGAFKWLWKVLVAAGIGLLALLKKLFHKKDA